MADFSSIPAEILGLIFERICKKPFVDGLNFSEFAKEWRSILTVSKEWKSIADEKLSHLLPRAILLYLHDEKKSPLLRHLQGKLGFASNNGWLLIADTCQMFLLNPLTKHRIPLPYPPCRNLHDAIITLKFNSTTDYQVAIYENRILPRYFSRIFACKAGDEKWTILEAWPYAKDVAYYNQKIYVSNDWKEFHVFSEINAARKHKVYYPSSDFTYDEYPAYPAGRSYLVETPQKELLTIIRYAKKKSRWGNTKTIDFKVFKIDDKRIDENWFLDKVEDLGDNVVFLGANSLCLLAQDVPGCTANSIYFADDRDSKEDMGVFRMEDRRIEPLLQDYPLPPALMLWFTPNLNS